MIIDPESPKSPEFKKIEFKSCSWCNALGATHQGGFITEDDGLEEGFFCNENCFKLFRIWKISLLEHQKKALEQKEVVRW